jgi:transcriptional regulator with XRE-family HTH domain
MWVQQREYKKLGSVLCAAREAAGLTQQVLAKRLSKPQSFVSSYESGQRRLDILEFLRMAAAIDADPIKLFAEVLKTDPSLRPKSSKR